VSLKPASVSQIYLRYRSIFRRVWLSSDSPWIVLIAVTFYPCSLIEIPLLYVKSLCIGVEILALLLAMARHCSLRLIYFGFAFWVNSDARF